MYRLKSRIDLISARRAYSAAFSSQSLKILVCAGTGCVAGGSLDIYARLKELIDEKGLYCQVELDHEHHSHGHDGCDSSNVKTVGLKKSGCHGFCEMGPLVRIEPYGYLYTKVKLEDCEEIVEKTVMNGEIVERLSYHKDGVSYPRQEDIPFYKKQTRLVLEHCGHIDATSLPEYLAIGGYSAFEKVLFDMTPDSVIKLMEDSGLRGRGGGGYPTGKKWAQVARQKAEQKYIVCNGDEGDPGAFMDRSVMEGDPHRMIEGMMIAGIACGATEGYIYVRAEYPLAVERLKMAIEQDTSAGLLGDNILGSGKRFHLHINRGAGAFVCGEGSALTASIEGKRGMPRVKPPRTVEHGLFDCPTVLNNVETFANVAPIINNGIEWFRSFDTPTSPGTKVFALTGKVRNTGLVEVPLGTTLRELVEEIGGGIPGGKKFKAAQTGGPSGGCIPASLIDTPIDYDNLMEIGSMMGSGGLIVMDEDTCMVDIAKFFLEFTVDESCGKCTPCRVGTKRLLELLEKITSGNGTMRDLERIEELAQFIKENSLCGLGQTAPNPVLSTLQYFRDEYLAHIQDKRCPAGVCKALLTYKIDETKCRGCTLCARACPAGAINGSVRNPHNIDTLKCVKCGACMETCRFGAISKG